MKTQKWLLAALLLVCYAYTSAQDFSESKAYGFSMIPILDSVKTYPLQKDFLDSLRKSYLQNDMPYYYRHNVWKNLDSNNVPIVQYTWGDFRNPVTTAQTAYAFLDDYYATGDSNSLQGFLNNAEWCLANHRDYYMEYDFSFSHRSESLDSSWVSGMAQGQVLGVLCRAYMFTGDIRFRDAADGVFATMYSNSLDHWTVWVDKDGYYWLEEYPSSKFCHVLNGKLFALWCIWDYYVISDDETALTVFLAGIRTIADKYAIWNVPNSNNSYYCKHHNTISKYHDIHQVQLKAYADFFGIDEFEKAIALYTNQKVSINPLEAENVQFSNYPNPFYSKIQLEVQLTHLEEVRIEIRSANGKLVNVLWDGKMMPGTWDVVWIPTTESVGIYTAHIYTPSAHKMSKLVYLGK